MRHLTTVAPPTFVFIEIAGFKTSSRSYLLKHGVPRHPDAIDRYTSAHEKICGYFVLNCILPHVEQPRNVR